jgi:hypothetical protein
MNLYTLSEKTNSNLLNPHGILTFIDKHLRETNNLETLTSWVYLLKENYK